MLKFVRWFREEIIMLIPAIIYFAICFNLFHFALGLMLQPQDVRFTSYLGATLGAILAGKVILVAESLPFINAFPRKPILYNILWKFSIYSFFVFFVQILDHTVKKIYHTGSWSIAYTSIKADVSHSLFWGIQITVLMFFLIFIVFSELVRVVGKQRIKEIFFG